MYYIYEYELVGFLYGTKSEQMKYLFSMFDCNMSGFIEIEDLRLMVINYLSFYYFLKDC